MLSIQVSPRTTGKLMSTIYTQVFNKYRAFPLTDKGRSNISPSEETDHEECRIYKTSHASTRG